MRRAQGSTRRQFLAESATIITAPLIVPASALGRGEELAPSERVTMACIGVGGRGGSNLNTFKRNEKVQIVAVCDVDGGHLTHGLRAAGLEAGAGTRDFREVLRRDDIDTVMVGTPDHWHALITISAVEAKKDVYCEKPLVASIREGQAVQRAVKQHRRIVQCGTQRRSKAGCRFACELVRNGRIGALKRVEVGVPGKFAVRGGYTGTEDPQSVPSGFDYEMWLGPAPRASYTAARCHFNFRWVLDYAPGYITDWGAHYLDIAQWGIGADETGPVQVDAQDVGFREKGIYNAPEAFRIVYTYASGVQAILTATTDQSKWGMKFIGEKGSIYVETDKVISEPESIATSEIGPDEIRLYESQDHHRNFIDCVRSRKRPAAPVEIAHRSASVCHLGAISAILGRKLRWDPEKERFVGDEEANRRISRPMREPWKLL